MRHVMRLRILIVLATVAVAACGPRAGTLEGAAAALGTASLNSIEFSFRAIHLAHAARPEGGDDLVRAEPRASSEAHAVDLAML